MGFAEPVEEVRDERRDIVQAIAQWRNHDVDDVDAIVKVFPKGLFGHRLEEIPARGGYDADVLHVVNRIGDGSLYFRRSPSQEQRLVRRLISLISSRKTVPPRRPR
jgi:hypothetical protein